MSTDASSQNSMFTDDELETLGKIKKVRIDLIDSMTTGGVPDKVGEIRVLNEVLASTDKMITDTATLRLKQEENANSEAAVSMVVELLHQSRAKKLKYQTEGDIPSIASELANVDTVDGETDVHPEQLDPSEFITPTFDASKA